MSNYERAWNNYIMWWPLNQECTKCIHKQNIELKDMQALGMFTSVQVLDDKVTGYEANETSLLYHASKCKLNRFLSPGSNCSGKQNKTQTSTRT